MLMENSTLKDVKILYPTFFSKLSPLQIDKFKPEEWANETANLSFEKTHLSYSAAKQVHIFFYHICFKSKIKIKQRN